MGSNARQVDVRRGHDHLQWKTDDDGLGLPDIVEDQQDLKQLMITNFHYIWGAGTEFDTKGDIMTFTLTFEVW